jgi:CBS domain containing-hemolysin-like protein
MKFSISNSIRWSILIAIVTFFLACIFTVASTAILEGATWAVGMVIVIILICIGIFFDVMGLAAAAASETPFHAMASEKVNGARHAIRIVRNADRFSNFCNDVIGDISGVISGAAGAAVVLKLLSGFHNAEWLSTVVSIVFTATVSALTVGGKAMGKSFAMHYSTEIVLLIGRIFYFIEHRLGIGLFSPKRKTKNHNGKRGNKRARTNQSA